MPLQCVAIPDAVCETVKHYLQPSSEQLSLCLYGEGAELSNIQAAHFIAWGGSAQNAAHHQLARSCSLPTLKSAIQKICTATEHRPTPLWTGWEVDSVRNQLTHPTQAAIDLTDKESTLLNYLMEHPNQTFEKTALLEAIWGYDNGIDTRTLETHIYRLRQKLDATQPTNNSGIVTEAEGYCWQI